MSDPRTDEALFLAYTRGDREAFEVLFLRLAPLLLRLFQRDVWRVQDAEELVQETFFRAHRAAADFRLGSPLRPWLFTIALNLRREFARRRSRRPESPLELDGRHDPSYTTNPVEPAETAQRVRHALSQLPPDQREVIELHWLAELPMPEVATVVGATVSAVKVRAHRGYKRLRDLLAEV